MPKKSKKVSPQTQNLTLLFYDPMDQVKGTHADSNRQKVNTHTYKHTIAFNIIDIQWYWKVGQYNASASDLSIVRDFHSTHLKYTPCIIILYTVCTVCSLI